MGPDCTHSVNHGGDLDIGLVHRGTSSRLWGTARGPCVGAGAWGGWVVEPLALSKPFPAGARHAMLVVCKHSALGSGTRSSNYCFARSTYGVWDPQLTQMFQAQHTCNVPQGISSMLGCVLCTGTCSANSFFPVVCFCARSLSLATNEVMPLPAKKASRAHLPHRRQAARSF